jgi:hypothetical protein
VAVISASRPSSTGGGRSGRTSIRRWPRRKAASAAGAAAKEIHVQAGQPSLWPSVSGATISSSPARAAPRRAHRRGRRRAAVGRQHAPPGDDRRDADRDVDQEDRPPAVPGRDQHAAEDLAGHGAAGERERVPADRPRPRLAVEVDLDTAQHLGQHQRGARALQHARDDQQRGLRREPGAQRGSRAAPEAPRSARIAGVATLAIVASPTPSAARAAGPRASRSRRMPVQRTMPPPREYVRGRTTFHHL